MVNWSGYNLQLVWFLSGADQPDAALCFEKLWQFKPDQVQQNRIPSAANPFLSTAMAEQDDRQYQVQVQPGRVDLLLSPLPTESDPFANLLDFEKSIHETLEHVIRERIFVDGVYRLSIVATQVKPVEKYSEAAAEIYKSIGVDLDLGEVSDFLFQINSRKDYEDRVVNRLVQFSVLSVQGMMLPFQSQMVSHSAPPRLAGRRQFDFNTVPDGRVLDVEKQNKMFSWIASEIMRVANEGSVASLRS